MSYMKIYTPIGATFADVLVTDEAQYSTILMKEDKVTLSWNSDTGNELPVGSYIMYNGQKYRTTAPYFPETKDSYEYSYTPEFHHEIYLLQNVPFLLYSYDQDGNVTQVESDWDFTGNIQTLESLIRSAIKEAIGVEYSIETDDKLKTATKAITMSVTNLSILSVLNQIASQLEAEWWYRDNTIYFTEMYIHSEAVQLTAGTHVSIPSQSDKTEFHNRFYVFGSTRNIPQDYQGSQINTIVNKRLTLNPSKHPNGYIDLPVFDSQGNVLKDNRGNYMKSPNAPNGTNKLGVFAEVLMFNDIYPHSPLVVWSVQTLNKYVRDGEGKPVVIGHDEQGEPIYDIYPIFFLTLVKGVKNDDGVYEAELDKDGFPTQFFLNDTTYDAEKNPTGSKIKGLEQEIHFSSGSLQGREFKFGYYDEEHKKKRGEDGGEIDVPKGAFEIVFTQDNTIIVPNAVIAPKVGDNVIAFNIKMPDEYFAPAYEELEQEALKAIYNENKFNTEFSVNTNQIYFTENNFNLAIGSHITLCVGGRVLDTRITAITESLNNQGDKKLTLSKEIHQGTITTLVKEADVSKQNEIVIETESRREINEARRQAFINTQELQESIFDTDGYFKDGNIKPETIETLMLSVGAVSSNLELSGVTFIANSDGTSTTNPNAVLVSQTNNARLIHFGISESEVKEWNLTKPASAFTRDEEGNAFVSASPYYLYARCASNGNSGSFVFSLNKYQYNQFVETNNVYYFMIGILSSVIDGYRILNTTYGNTAIVGNQIRTGVIKSNAENMEIDLDNGIIWSENGVEFRLKGQRRNLADYATETDSAIEATSEKVDNIKIGGVNLQPKSKLDSKDSYSTPQYISGSLANVRIVEDAEMGLVSEFTETNGTSILPFRLKANTEYTISLYARCTQRRNDTDACCKFRQLFATTDLKTLVDLGTDQGIVKQGVTIVARDSNPDLESGECIVPVDMEWHRYYAVIKVDEVVASKQLSIRLGIMGHSPNQGSRGRFSRLQIEEGNKVTEWREAQADIDERTQAKIDEVNRGIQQQLEDLESQIDNEIEYWFYDYEPKATNAPANTWTTEEDKKNHIGDVFYWESEGTTYNWVQKDGVYQWYLMENGAAAKALAEAQKALTAVGDKSAVIFGGTQPKTPYQKGDMWSRGSNYPILICTAEGTHTTYNASHWEDATSYIDNEARQNASEAVNTANSASNKVDNLKIGGGNLYKSTSEWIVIGGGASISKHDKSYNGRTITTTSTNVNTRIRYIVDQANINYAISFNVLSSVSGKIIVDVNDNSATGVDVVANTSKRVELVLNTTRYDPSTYNFIDFLFAQIGTYKISNLKIEKSDKCTSWSPAPEDVQASIKEAYDLADTAKNNAEATDNALKAVDSDGIFSTIEKRTMRPQWQAISGVANTTGAWTASGSAKNVYDNAISAGYTSSDTLVKAVYDNFVALRTYLNGVGLYSDINFTFNASYTRAQLSSKFQDYHKAEVALSEATASKLASNAQTNATNSAKTYTDGQVATLNGRIDQVAQTANNAYSNASQYEYLKQAIAESESGTQAEGYSVVMSGGAVLSNVLEARNTSGKVTAGVSGLDSDDGDSLAFWAGAERTDGSIPFSVTHNGEVTMSKARITSGSNTGSQVTITSTEGGNVGAIMVGSQGGADTQILGKASGGIEGMKTNAGIGGSSSTSTISATSVYADNIFTYKEATFTQQGHPTNPKITPSPVSQSVVKQMTLLNNPSHGGVITLGNISFSNRTSNPSLVGTGAFASNSNNSANIYEQVLVDVLVGNSKPLSASGNITMKYKNATATISESLDDIKSTISGKKVTFGAGESVIIKITKTSTLSCFSSASNPNLDGTLSASGGGVYTTFNISQSSYVMQMFNNVVYNDGMFMSRASNRYIAMSTASSDKIMEMVCGERGMAFTSAQGLGMFARLSSGIDKSKINAVMGVLWYGRFVFNNATISSVENWGGSLSFSTSSIARANSMITITYGVTLIQVPILEVRLDTSSVNDWTAVPRQITTTQCKFSIIQGSNANYTSGAVVVCIKQI